MILSTRASAPGIPTATVDPSGETSKSWYVDPNLPIENHRSNFCDRQSTSASTVDLPLIPARVPIIKTYRPLSVIREVTPWVRARFDGELGHTVGLS